MDFNKEINVLETLHPWCSESMEAWRGLEALNPLMHDRIIVEGGYLCAAGAENKSEIVRCNNASTC